MKGILVLVALCCAAYAVCYLLVLWFDWKGAFGRWKRGEPLRLSELQQKLWQAERDRTINRKKEMREKYEAQPFKILDSSFRREFKSLEIPSEIRSEVVRRCGFLCGACGREIRRMKTLHIDHIKPMKLYPELEFLSSNLQVLCSRCNAHKSAYDGHDWKEVVADRRKATLRRRAKAKLNSDANSS